MIKQQYVVICDLCGRTEKAQPSTFRNETEYGPPKSWRTSPVNDRVHICPNCGKHVPEASRSYEVMG